MPHTTQLLADLGATVVKLEPPTGDPIRGFPELFDDVAAGKRSVAVDLRTDEGARSRSGSHTMPTCSPKGGGPGSRRDLGVGYDDVRAVNPSIVYCSLSGYGQTGPLAATPGHDLNYQARAGALVNRERATPTRPAFPCCPSPTSRGRRCSRSSCARPGRRLQTGEGEYVDVSMTDVVASSRGGSSTTKVAGRDEPMRGSAGYGVFRCADGAWLTLGVIAEDHFWAAVCDALALDDVRDVRTRNGCHASKR